jgi:hypothetical protein
MQPVGSAKLLMSAWPVMPGWQDNQGYQYQIRQEYEILPRSVGERGLWDGARVTR